MKVIARALLLVVGLAPGLAAEAPSVDHQPVPCTLPEKPSSLCATITSEGQVAAARIYFRPANDKFYSFVDMAFGGLQFCGTLPGAHVAKVAALEYYVQAVDDKYESQRTSTFNMNVTAECEFPPVLKDAPTSPIVVHATSQKQGKKLPEEFVQTGATFVPVVTH